MFKRYANATGEDLAMFWVNQPRADVELTPTAQLFNMTERAVQYLILTG